MDRFFEGKIPNIKLDYGIEITEQILSMEQGNMFLFLSNLRIMEALKVPTVEVCKILDSLGIEYTIKQIKLEDKGGKQTDCSCNR